MHKSNGGHFVMRGLLGLAMTAIAATSVGATGETTTTYEVTITNLTRNQIFAPAAIAGHDGSMAVFIDGDTASDALSALAEDGDPSDFLDELDTDGFDAGPGPGQNNNGMVHPGETSAPISVEIGDGFDRISVIGMLVTTNDAFYAARGIALPEDGAVARANAPAYDAGSEANNEDCRFIPGPPCGNPEVRDTEGAEGYIHIHSGIHSDQRGSNRLIASRDDWRNPVARITVRVADEP